MTFSWGLLMTLWLPLIDSAKSYDQAFTNMHLALPITTVYEQFKCWPTSTAIA